MLLNQAAEYALAKLAELFNVARSTLDSTIHRQARTNLR
jgi:hypothetical protein